MATPSRKRKIDSVYETPGQSRITQHFPVAKTPRRTMKALTLCRPDVIVGRDRELSILREYISSRVRTKNPGSLYISGPPGTGKTLCVSEVVGEVENSQVRTLNCMTTQNVMKAIFSSLGGKGKKSAEEWVERFICSSKDSIILVLEEVDHLKKMILHRVFELPALDNSKLILIGISNVLDLTLPRHTPPTIVRFKPYKKEELYDILSSRVGTSTIHTAALRFCASKVSARNGDIRDALNYCRAAIEASRGQQVTVHHLNQVMNSPGESSMMWPLLNKLAACTLLLEETSTSTLSKLYDCYSKICTQRSLRRESEDTFFESILSLEIVKVERKKALRDWKVGLSVPKDELRHQLRDKTLIDSILADQLS